MAPLRLNIISNSSLLTMSLGLMLNTYGIYSTKSFWKLGITLSMDSRISENLTEPALRLSAIEKILIGWIFFSVNYWIMKSVSRSVWVLGDDSLNLGI